MLETASSVEAEALVSDHPDIKLCLLDLALGLERGFPVLNRLRA